MYIDFFNLENVLYYNTNSHSLPVDSLRFYFSIDIHIICELHIALVLSFYSFYFGFIFLHLISLNKNSSTRLNRTGTFFFPISMTCFKYFTIMNLAIDIFVENLNKVREVYLITILLKDFVKSKVQFYQTLKIIQRWLNASFEIC